VNILNVINEDLGPSTDISLVTLVNTLCQGVVNLLVGSISDVIGRRWFLIGGQIFGIVGAVLGGSSRNISMLVGASVFTGIGAACQLTYPLLVMEIVPNKYRGWAQGIITLSVLPSLGFGPIVGRAIIESWGWRGTYWVSAIINGIGLVLLFVFYFPPNFVDLQDKKSAWQQAKEIDYLGFVLYAGSIICILLGLSQSLQTCSGELS
jgi:MFS family permease